MSCNSSDDCLHHIKTVLNTADVAHGSDPDLDDDQSAGPLPEEQASGLRPAAVLVPIISRPDKTSLLLTKRASDHPHHAGQISFPGGMITTRDKSIRAAALRETFEETGIEARHIDILGHLSPLSTGTGFTIHPVVARVAPSFDLVPCRREVEEIFEIPFSFVMKAQNYRIERITWRGSLRKFYVIDCGSRRIWGATAAILKSLQEKTCR